MFKNAKHANGDITVFLWRSPTQMWNIVGTVKGTFASLLQQLEMVYGVTMTFDSNAVVDEISGLFRAINHLGRCVKPLPSTDEY